MQFGLGLVSMWLYLMFPTARLKSPYWGCKRRANMRFSLFVYIFCMFQCFWVKPKPNRTRIPTHIIQKIIWKYREHRYSTCFFSQHVRTLVVYFSLHVLRLVSLCWLATYPVARPQCLQFALYLGKRASRPIRIDAESTCECSHGHWHCLRQTAPLCSVSTICGEFFVPAGGSASLGSLVRWRNRSTQFEICGCVAGAPRRGKKLLRREDEWGVVVGQVLFTSLKSTLDVDQTKW